MAVISFLSQKGGAGKSTLARGAAVEFARNDWNVMVADMDIRQRTFSNWAEDRRAAGLEPPVRVQTCNDHLEVLALVKSPDQFDLVVIDGRPYADEQSAKLATMSDLVVIPTGTTKDDLVPALEFGESLRSRFKGRADRILFAVVRVPSEREAKEALASIRDWGFEAPDSYMEFKTSYGQAMDAGRAMTETAFAGVSKKGDDLMQAIADRFVRLI